MSGRLPASCVTLRSRDDARFVDDMLRTVGSVVLSVLTTVTEGSCRSHHGHRVRNVTGTGLRNGCSKHEGSARGHGVVTDLLGSNRDCSRVRKVAGYSQRLVTSITGREPGVLDARWIIPLRRSAVDDLLVSW